jgi:hypothetical protein
LPTLLSIAYLPPLSYLQKCASDSVIIESKEHFIKQTYRNRCNIAGPNGKQTLIIPVVHERLSEISISEVIISYDAPWNKIHWKSMTSAYRNAPYFEYYEDEFRQLFDKPGEKLFDFNLALLNKLFAIFKINNAFSLTTAYEKNPTVEDLRNEIHPKKIMQHLNSYHQVFQEKNGFIKDLSVIDYLFNAGNTLERII